MAERLQISINWKANDENCVRRSFPQVGVDNLDKSAHGCSPLHSLGVLLPAQRCRDGSQTSERVGRVNLPLLIIATSCVTVRSPPCTSIVGSAACDAPSCTVLWALSQYHSRTHTYTYTCSWWMYSCLSPDILWQLRSLKPGFYCCTRLTVRNSFPAIASLNISFSALLKSSFNCSVSYLRCLPTLKRSCVMLRTKLHQDSNVDARRSGLWSDLDSAQDEQWKQRQRYRCHHQMCHLVLPESDLCRSVDDGDFHILQLVSACFQFTQSQPLRSNAAIWPLKTCVLQTFNTFYFVKQLINL